MLTATNSCGTVIGIGWVFLSAANFAKASMIGPKSVPLLPKKYLIPRARRISKYACPTVSTGIVTDLVISMKLLLDFVLKLSLAQFLRKVRKKLHPRDNVPLCDQAA